MELSHHIKPPRPLSRGFRGGVRPGRTQPPLRYRIEIEIAIDATPWNTSTSDPPD
jgi:hypothetical protein